MSKLTLQQKLRTGHVKRWQIVRVAREQTIAEHMYRVRMIAMEICDRIQVSIFTRNYTNDWALIHDLPEVITGDIATPTKRAMREAVPDSDPVKRIELSLDEEYRTIYEKIKEHYPVVLSIVKQADLIEAIDFLNIEGMGDHALLVKESLIAALRESIWNAENQYQDYDWQQVSAIYTEITHREFNDIGLYPVTR